MAWIVRPTDENNDASQINIETKEAISNKNSLKRKRKSSEKNTKKPSNTKAERVADDAVDLDALNDMKWSSIPFPLDIPMNDNSAGGFLELEEIDGVDVFYDDTEKGRVVKFKPTSKWTVSSTSDQKPDSLNEQKDQSKDEDEMSADIKDEPKKAIETKFKSIRSEDVSDTIVDEMSSWAPYHLDRRILYTLHENNFFHPTDIQARVLGSALTRRDVFGAAETGSGKTLAFGLPIIQHILKNPRDDNERPLRALILTPTRELALQIRDHLHALTSNLGIFVMAVVGGMSIEKQQRQFKKCPSIIVATPGRLWELMSDGEPHLMNLNQLEFFVLDEADRMIENGHFRDLDSIVAALQTKEVTNEWPEHENEEEKQQAHRRTFIFSATLTRKQTVTKKGKECPSTLDNLLDKIDFQDPQPICIDLSRKDLVASSVCEARLVCSSSDKDIYLYYLLARYPCRTLVFVNSIATVRRIVPLLQNLELPVYPLHASMPQRQRLKNLDRFKSNPKAILIASDVASRGVDIKGVELVIHFHVPRTVENYVHRSGRTGRGRDEEGVSILLCGEDEVKDYREVCRGLNRSYDAIPEFPVDRNLWPALKTRLSLSKQLDSLLHENKKKKAEKSFTKRVAEALDIETEDDSEYDSDNGYAKKDQRQRKIKDLKNQLKHALKRALMPTGGSLRYPTASVNGHLFLRNLMQDKSTDSARLSGHTSGSILDVFKQ